MIDGSGSPVRPLADVHFREIDSEFLNQQARIWLETMLAERFDTETSLADLLEDGDILNRVSIKIRCMLPKSSEGEPASPKSLIHEVSVSSLKYSHSGKYLPYSNVDSFLKICKSLGLTAVDLFSPPDVVEKKDIRRVCLCIRALSRKAQMKNLDVPEFDSVTHHVVVTMPTEFVGGIRDSLTQANVARNLSQQHNETPNKVGLNPLNFKRHLNMRIGHSSSEFLEELEYKEMVNDNGDDGNAYALTTLETPSVEDIDEDLGFSTTSRSSALSDDKMVPLDSSFLFEDKVCANYAEYQSDSNISHDIVDEKLESSQVSNADDNDATMLKSMEMKLYKSSRSSDGSNGEKGRRRGAWMPLLASGFALLGTLLMIKSRSPPIYQIKKGDTLSEIARRTGKSGWEELVNLNPTIKNPNLIYPDEKLKLHP